MKTLNKVATKEYIDPAEDMVYNKGGVPYKKSTTYSAQKTDVVPYIKAALSDNDQYAAGAIKEWNELTPQEKEKYHVANPQNPILEMAVDRHWKEWVKSEVKETRNTMGRGGSKGFDWNLGVGSGNNRNGDFIKKNDIPIQNLPPYKEWYDLQLGSVPTVTQKILTFKDARTGETKTLNKAISFKIVGYSPDNDKLLLSVEEDVLPSKGESKTGYLPKETKIEVDASLYDDLLKAKPYGFSREAILGKTPPSKPSPIVTNVSSIFTPNFVTPK
jgi:hypothetical protein